MSEQEAPIIGLRRGVVQVVAHDPRWLQLFEEERRLLQTQIGDLVVDVQHVGSTAVAGLAAKPILDLAVAVRSIAMRSLCVPRLCGIGYLDRGDQGTAGGYLLAKGPRPDVRTHHLHIVTIDDPQWHEYLHFRDRLRLDAPFRTRYAKLKRALQARFPENREAYTAAKHEFIRQALHGDGR